MSLHFALSLVDRAGDGDGGIIPRPLKLSDEATHVWQFHALQLARAIRRGLIFGQHTPGHAFSDCSEADSVDLRLFQIDLFESLDNILSNVEAGTRMIGKARTTKKSYFILLLSVNSIVSPN